jgi:predicted ester cyclase
MPGEAERLIRDLVDHVWNSGHLDDIEHFFAPGFDHGGREDTPEGVREWHRADARTWTDARWEVLTLVSDGERVAVRWRCTARHTGQWGPIPPTGKTITWEGAHFFTVRNGQITAMWAIGDAFGKALQLGGTLAPPEAGA